MAEYAGGFGAGFAPGLSQAGGWFSLVPQLREQAARLEEKRSREGLTTLKEALDLPSDVRGPYIDHLVQTLGIDPTLGQMFKRAGDETTADIAEVLRVGLEADPVRTARVIQAKGGKEMMTFLSTLSKVKAASAQGTALAGLVGGLEGPATPSGYSFERTETPQAAPPPQAPPGPELLAGPAEDVPTTTGTGTLGGVAGPPPGAAPRPAPIDLRPTGGPTGAFREAYQSKLSTYESEMQRLGDLTRKAMVISRGGLDENTQRFIQSERQRIESQYKPALEGMGKRLEALDKEGGADLEARDVQDPATGRAGWQYFSKRTSQPVGAVQFTPFKGQSPEGQSLADVVQAETVLGKNHPYVKQLRDAVEAKAEKTGLDVEKTKLDMDYTRANIAKVQAELKIAMTEATQGKYNEVSQMRDKFTDVAKFFREADYGFSRIKVGRDQDDLAGDITLIYGLAKMLDPTGAVREGDYNSIAQNPGVPGYVKDFLRGVTSNRRLDAATRARIVNAATSMHGEYLRNHEAMESEFTRLAKERRFKPEEVIINFRTPQVRRDDPTVGTPGGPTPRAALPPTVVPQARAGVAERGSAAAKATDAASKAVDDFSAAYANWMKRTRKVP